MNNFIEKIESSFRESKLPSWILRLDGFSGRLYREFINNLVESVEDARYLEIGCWKGSTSCSAIYGNTVQACLVDNWSEFGGPRDEFLSNIESVHCSTVDIKESDFRDLDYTSLGKYNIYFFDGPHTEQDQYDGLFLAQDALDEEYIFICDDWNWEQVRQGTERAILELGLEVLYKKEIQGIGGGGADSEWHNGYLISVLKKK